MKLDVASLHHWLYPPATALAASGMQRTALKAYAHRHD